MGQSRKLFRYEKGGRGNFETGSRVSGCSVRSGFRGEILFEVVSWWTAKISRTQGRV